MIGVLCRQMLWERSHGPSARVDRCCGRSRAQRRVSPAAGVHVELSVLCPEGGPCRGGAAAPPVRARVDPSEWGPSPCRTPRNARAHDERFVVEAERSLDTVFRCTFGDSSRGLHRRPPPGRTRFPRPSQHGPQPLALPASSRVHFVSVGLPALGTVDVGC